MTSWVQTKYINLLSNRLLKFKKKSQNLYNFRCHYCGDSEKNQNKARAYFFAKDADFVYYCHNCATSLSFERFLKDFDKGLYEQYLFEKLGNKGKKYFSEETAKKKIIAKSNPFKDLVPISDLKNNHPAKKYILDRKIPGKYISDLYYCEEFKSWTNTQIKDKFEDLTLDEERIIIPFRDRNNTLIGYQGRLLFDRKGYNIRYITIMFDEMSPKVFNLNRVDFNYTYYVLEGPFDAMFVKNSIATAGGKISSELNKIGCNIENAVIVYDNEPRNVDVARNIGKAVKGNYRTVIWPSRLEYKDINDMILAGYTEESILQIMKENTFKGLEAELRFNEWKRV